MKLRLGVALLALASVPLAGTPALSAPPAAVVSVNRPIYLNIVVNSVEQGPEPQFDAPPTWRVERIQPRDGDTTLSPEVDCSTSFLPRVHFQVTCVQVNDPATEVLPNTVSVQGRYCTNASVRADIAGPVPGEQVTGRITCGEQQQIGAACTATAGTLDPTAGGYSGTCVAFAPNGPLPIRCWVDLTRVNWDRWQVTCYGTDP